MPWGKREAILVIRDGFLVDEMETSAAHGSLFQEVYFTTT
jgi:hypothetical protein